MKKHLKAPAKTQGIDTPELTETLEIVSQFAREAARGLGGHLDLDDVAQEVALHVMLKLRDGAAFGGDGRTRVYVKNAVYWMVTAKWRKAKRARAWMATQEEPQAELTPEALSPEFGRIVESLTPEQRELLFRVAVNEETVADLSDELARARVEARGSDWAALDEASRLKEGEKAYQTVYRRYTRTRDELRKRLSRP
jgi:DNA-directed RNA polymerase specialized sigma24 family protein